MENASASRKILSQTVVDRDSEIGDFMIAVWCCDLIVNNKIQIKKLVVLSKGSRRRSNHEHGVTKRLHRPSMHPSVRPISGDGVRRLIIPPP